MSDFLIRQVGKDTIDQQIAVLSGPLDRSEDSDGLRNGWTRKHYCNPLGDSIIFGAFSGGKMAGINAFMPMEYRWNDRVLRVVQSCDSGVDPDFRRRGIWAAIIKRAMDYFSRETSYDAMIGFPNYHNSYPGFLKLGWTHTLSLSNLIMINSGQAVAEQYLPAALAPVGNVAAIQKLPARLTARPLGRCVTERTPEPELPLSPDKGTLTLNLSREWLDWKASYKGFQSYAVSRDGKKIADFLFQESKSGRFKYLKFIAGAPCDNRAALAACLLSFSERKDVAMIRLMCANPAQYRGLGFVNIRAHHNPFIVYPLNPDLKDTLLNPSLWRIGPLDLD